MIAITLFAIVLSLLLVGWLKLRKAQSHWKRLGVPHRKPKFIFGDFTDQILRLKSTQDLFDGMYYSFSDVRYIGVYSLHKAALVIKDPELIKQIAIKDFDYFTDRTSFVPEEVDPIWAQNLFALKGQKWRDMRATLSPAFTSSKIKYLFNLINESAQNFTTYFVENPNECQSLEAKDVLSRFANDVIATSAFGIKVDSLKDKNNEFYLMGKKITSFDNIFSTLALFVNILFPSFAKFFKLRIFPEKLQKSFAEIVINNIKEREEKMIKRPDMIDILLEAKRGRLRHDEEEFDEKPSRTREEFSAVEESTFSKQHKNKTPITDYGIASQAMIFFFAGFDTASTCMSFLFYELAVNPDVQKKLQEEIDQTLKQSLEGVTYEVITKMKYLDMVVCEALRKWPPTAVIDRVCVKPYIIQPTREGENPIRIEIGTGVAFPHCSLQNDPKYFSNPEKFVPERFSDENKSKIVPYTYMPFGIGPRACIGSRFALLEVKVLVVHLLSKLDIVTTEKTQIPVKICPKKPPLTAQGGIWIGLERRFKNV